jgi:hypothetical protein
MYACTARGSDPGSPSSPAEADDVQTGAFAEEEGKKEGLTTSALTSRFERRESGRQEVRMITSSVTIRRTV